MKYGLLHTRVSQTPHHWMLCKMVAAQLPHLKWRRHGIGALQAYIFEHPLRELRVHLWSPLLIVDGILESGNAHNHRFSMRSRVLLGDLQHTEWLSSEGAGHVLCNVYDFKHARIHKTNDDRTELSPLPGQIAVQKLSHRMRAGSTYTFERGAYHDSLPLTPIVVTLVEKYDQRDERARVIAPVDKPPVPAFGSPEPDQDLVRRLVEQARMELLQ